MTKITSQEFLHLVRRLQEARDKYGNRLYSDTEVAGYLGYSSIKELNDTIDKARKILRSQLIKRAAALKEEGKTNEEIAERMGLSEDTVDMLLDVEGNARIDKVKLAQEEYMKNMTKGFDDIFANLFKPSK